MVAGPSTVFSPDVQRLAACADMASALDRARQVVGGRYQAYRNEWRPLPDAVVDWLRNPDSGYEYDSSTPWWHVEHFDLSAGDIKAVWEPARFSWVFDLARAFLLTGDSRFRDVFEKRFAAWHLASPAFRGPHWACGQEVAIRATALLYAESAFDLTGGAHQSLIEVLSASGERIEDAVGYAISQRNNHGISEATGLIALGVRFRETHSGAQRWLTLGRAVLEQCINEQFAVDGWYVQHSFNYLRLALDQCVIAQRALVGSGLPGLSRKSVGRLQAACELLIEVIDGTTGAVPNHGPNDGAFVHPVTTAKYEDYRPSLTAACASFGTPVPADIGLDPEPLAWLCLNVPETAEPRPNGVRVGRSGWSAMRVDGIIAFLRAGKYASRPAHLDLLHLDIRWDGTAVTVDPGTFSYNAPPPWNNGLVVARVHNGPTLDDEEPARRGPRFLWLNWPSARIVDARFSEEVGVVVAEIPGRVSRRVEINSEGITVTDTTLAPDVRKVRVCWLLDPCSSPGLFRCSEPFRLIHAAEGDVTAWYSPYYDYRLASQALIVESPGRSIVCSRFLRDPDHARKHVGAEVESRNRETASAV